MTQPDDVFAPARLGPVELRNRVIMAATFVGVTPREAYLLDRARQFRTMPTIYRGTRCVLISPGLLPSSRTGKDDAD